MKMKQIQAMAKEHKINPFRKTKVELIREIQRAEGNFDCFGTAIDDCDQLQCCFRELCLLEPKKRV